MYTLQKPLSYILTTFGMFNKHTHFRLIRLNCMVSSYSKVTTDYSTRREWTQLASKRVHKEPKLH